ncbi:MAG: PaaI family thioesterase [Deltaproteobacteria bacterium]|nr:PaaI family thioesterase [Deltaproteobacteria bacterium]MBW2070184.1 PaaI family thioesterase [Deltaproteobacteria bacterium]
MQITEKQRLGISERLRRNPIISFMGIEMIAVRPGTATLALPYRKEIENSMGVVQGGVLAVLADVTGGMSLYSVLADPLRVVIPTIEFKLNFLRPATAGMIISQGQVVHRGRQIALCQVELRSEAGKLFSVGLFTYMIQDLGKGEGS